MPSRAPLALLCAACLAGCRTPPQEPMAADPAASLPDPGAWRVRALPIFGWRHYDRALLDAGHGQLLAGLGFDATPPGSPIGIEGRAAFGFMERVDDFWSDSASSLSAEGQVGLLVAPWRGRRATPSLAVGGVIGHVDADELVDTGGFIFNTHQAVGHSDDYTGLYVRGALDFPLRSDASFRLELTRSFGAEATLGNRLVDLDSWDLLFGMVLRF